MTMGEARNDNGGTEGRGTGEKILRFAQNDRGVEAQNDKGKMLSF